MKGFSITSALAAASMLASTTFAAAATSSGVDPIVIKGSKFFYKTNGTQL
jgi:hypothetical protein